MVGEKLCAPSGDTGRDTQRQAGQGVDRSPERDEAGQVSSTSIGGSLVAEHAALRIPAEVNVAAGVLVHLVHDLADGDDVIGQSTAPPALFGIGRTEIDHPRVHAHAVQNAGRTLIGGDVVHVRGDHHRRNQHHRRTVHGNVVGEVTPQPIHRLAVHHPERRRIDLGLETTQPDDLEAVLGRCDSTPQWTTYRVCIQSHKYTPAFGPDGTTDIGLRVTKASHITLVEYGEDVD